MWTLLMTLTLMQQSPGTPVTAVNDQLAGFATEQLCTTARDKWVNDRADVATEPEEDYTPPAARPDEPQPRESQFQLMVPTATCVQLR